MTRLLAFAFMALVVPPAWAQRVEVSPLVSYTTSAPIDARAADVTELTMAHHVTWSGQGTYFISEHIGVEGLWAYGSNDLLSRL